MSKSIAVAGIDIGSNKVCCACGIYDKNLKIVKVVAATSIECDGIKAGAVINIQEAATAINKAIEEVEKNSDYDINDVIIAMRGNFIKSKSAKGIANINYSNKEVTEETIENVLENAKKQIKIEAEEEIFQILPREYILNQQKGIQNPIGMEGNHIEVDVHAFLGCNTNLCNISKAMHSIGIDYSDRVYGYLVASDILVTKEEKELSCIVIDFGGLTTGIVHYLHGLVKHTDELSEGSDYITRDIGHKLRATYAVSKQIKETYGAAFVLNGFKNEEFEYKAADGISFKKYNRLDLVNGIITPRFDRILYQIKEIIKINDYGDEFLSGGVIITGGGSKLMYITEAIEKAFNCSVRTGIPASTLVEGSSSIILNPSYITAIGAIVFNFSNTKKNSSWNLNKKIVKNDLKSKILKWFEEVF
ncbi:MAG: cell division protein FtsA [Endomicrobium sp.]|jgi:cell division protein FtsA|nr:cell division protein FtsA [Endomicrobium sp.]